MRSQLSSCARWLTKFRAIGKKRRSYMKTGYRRVLVAEQLESRCLLATFTVTNDADVPVNSPGSAGTLRQAIFDANQFPDTDNIEFSTTPAHGLNGGTITLTQGRLDISESVIIDATMLPSGLTIDQTIATAVMQILPASGDLSFTLDGLTITGGEIGGGIQYFRLGKRWITDDSPLQYH
jgi:hypothetical protein